MLSLLLFAHSVTAVHVIVGLGVTSSRRDPRFTGSNLIEVDVFFSGCKNPEHKSSGRDFRLGVPSLTFQIR